MCSFLKDSPPPPCSTRWPADQSRARRSTPGPNGTAMVDWGLETASCTVVERMRRRRRGKPKNLPGAFASVRSVPLIRRNIKLYTVRDEILTSRLAPGLMLASGRALQRVCHEKSPARPKLIEFFQTACCQILWGPDWISSDSSLPTTLMVLS